MQALLLEPVKPREPEMSLSTVYFLWILLSTLWLAGKGSVLSEFNGSIYEHVTLWGKFGLFVSVSVALGRCSNNGKE